MRNVLVPNATIAEPQRPVSSALNTWTRLEPLPLTSDLQPSLQAAIADPLWMLGRQWQFLEFFGEDAGTPVEVRVEGEMRSLSRRRLGPLGGTAADVAARTGDLDSGAMPLEVMVEAEPPRATHHRLAVEAGMQLQRLLAVARQGALRDRFLFAYPLAVETGGDAGADRFGAQWLALAETRALDGRKLAAALAPLRGPDGVLNSLPPEPTIPADAAEKVLDVLRRWLAWYEAQIVDPPASPAWNPRRQEYAFAVSAQATGGETVLACDEYADGTLDWYAMRIVTTTLGTPGSPAAPRALAPRATLPTPVDYPGKPADRFWEFQDAAVHFGAISAGPTDLLRMLLMEFSLVYGSDWFVVPLRLPVGSLTRLTKLVVRDTFGVVTTIDDTRDIAGGAWSLFALSGPPSLSGQRVAPGFFLPPVLAEALDGAPIEELALFRDEMANMAWGVERQVQGVAGSAYERASEASRRAAAQQIDGPPVDAPLVYRLATPVPAHWLPLVPVPAEGSDPGTAPVIQLQRRALLRTEADGTRRAIHPRGLLLRSDPSKPVDSEPALRIEEEEVPREGAVVTRSFQYARWFDGRSLLWLGRSKTAGRGEGASGLRFDVIGS
jgi:hypothetical protein